MQLGVRGPKKLRHEIARRRRQRTTREEVHHVERTTQDRHIRAQQSSPRHREARSGKHVLYTALPDGVVGAVEGRVQAQHLRAGKVAKVAAGVGQLESKARRLEPTLQWRQW